MAAFSYILSLFSSRSNIDSSRVSDEAFLSSTPVSWDWEDELKDLEENVGDDFEDDFEDESESRSNAGFSETPEASVSCKKPASGLRPGVSYAAALSSGLAIAPNKQAVEVKKGNRRTIKERLANIDIPALIERAFRGHIQNHDRNLYDGDCLHPVYCYIISEPGPEDVIPTEMTELRDEQGNVIGFEMKTLPGAIEEHSRRKDARKAAAADNAAAALYPDKLDVDFASPKKKSLRRSQTAAKKDRRNKRSKSYPSTLHLRVDFYNLDEETKKLFGQGEEFDGGEGETLKGGVKSPTRADIEHDIEVEPKNVTALRRRLRRKEREQRVSAGRSSKMASLGCD